MNTQDLNYIIENGQFPLEIPFTMFTNCNGKYEVQFDLEELEYEFQRLKYELHKHNMGTKEVDYFSFSEEF